MVFWELKPATAKTIFSQRIFVAPKKYLTRIGYQWRPIYYRIQTGLTSFQNVFEPSWNVCTVIAENSNLSFDAILFQFVAGASINQYRYSFGISEPIISINIRPATLTAHQYLM